MKDLIFCCYSTVSGSTLSSIKEGPNDRAYFRPEIPNVAFVDVPYTQKPEEVFSSPAFGRAARERMQGGLLKNLIRYSRIEDVRSVGFLTFSGGTEFLKVLMQNTDEAKNVDSVICLDGLHFNLDWQKKPFEVETKPWVDFCKSAADGQKLAIFAHTNIDSPLPGKLTNTTESANFLTAKVKEYLGEFPAKTVLSKETWNRFYENAPPPKVSIKDPINKNIKSWETMPLDFAKSSWIGNYFDLDFGGKTAADHIFVATYVQRALLQAIVGPRLQLPDVICTKDSQTLVESCQKVLTKIPESDKYKATSKLPLLLGAIGGTALGYYLTRKFLA